MSQYFTDFRKLVAERLAHDDNWWFNPDQSRDSKGRFTTMSNGVSKEVFSPGAAGVSGQENKSISTSGFPDLPLMLAPQTCKVNPKIFLRAVPRSTDEANFSKYQQTYFEQKLKSMTRAGKILENHDLHDLLEKTAELPKLGALSELFESGGKGPGTISAGAGGDRGGVSYGTYQLASQFRIPQKFVASEGRPWADQLSATDVKSKEGDFAKGWKKIAMEDPVNFNDAQYKYMKRTHYDPVFDVAKKSGFDVSDIGIQNALWSQSVQTSWAGNRIILKNVIKKIKLAPYLLSRK